ncbi:MAG: polyprenyl synthetase family protein [Acidobacteria bacterium]|nr:polyprenyl synthetase family protein [Acidobacteriota bacterium]
MGFSKLGQSLTAREILDLIQGDLKLVEREINLASMAPVDAVTSIGQYLNSSGGKRIRPILLLLACRAAGSPGPGAISLAAVVEIIHAATLVHDDIIDAAETRRGKPSTNIVWGNHTSVLAGDWLYMQAFQIALRQRDFHVLDILITLTQMMVEGELLQLARIGKLGITEADYMELVDRKTASLFSACARLGAHAGGGSEEIERKLGDYGWNLGMAFQLVDDILDFTAREKTLGKPVGNDLREGKVTLPLIYALQRAEPGERTLVDAVLRQGGYDTVAFPEILGLVERHGGIHRARDRAHSFAEKAREIITGFPESPYQRALYAVTDLVTERDH